MIDALTSIWERLLKRSPIGSEENFFDLGGGPALNAELFCEIAKISGRELPPTTIYQAPTISALASLLEQPERALFSPLVLLRAGKAKPPIYIAHGLGGSVMDLFQLVKHLEAGHPVYGLQAKGLDGVSAPFCRIEEKAQAYLDAIRRLQPKGPYFLIGYSLGGLVMFEIARRLSANGDQVGVLAMVDSYPHPSRLRPAQRTLLAARLAGRRALLVLRWSRRMLGRAREETGKVELYRAPVHASFAAAIERVRELSYLALRRYKPLFYPGEIKFVRAETATKFPRDPHPVWAHLAAEFDLETVPGDHVTMLTTHFESLAAVLNRFLHNALHSGLRKVSSKAGML